MRMNKLVALFIIAIIVSPNLTIVRGQTLTLAPFDGNYEPGDDVSISGTAVAEANLTLIVVINSTTLYEANFTAEGDGNYTEDYEIPDNATEGVYTVTVSDGGESVDADFTVASDDSRELAETLIEQAEDGRDNTEDAFDELEDEGVEVPSEANSSYLQGVEYLNSAQELFDGGNYTGASDMAFEAIQSFGDALKVLNLQPKGELTASVENDQEDSPGLDGISIALERANRYWGKLDAAVTRLEVDNDYNVSSIRVALTEAKNALDESEDHIAEGNFTAAREDFTRARKVLGRINGLLKSSVKARKEKQAERFLEQFQKRVEKINGTLMGLQWSLEAGKTQRVQAILRSTAQKLLRLSDSLASGDLEGVIDEMENAVDELEDGIDELNGEGLSSQLKSANRFEARIESLNNTLQRLAEAGLETSELDEYMTDAKDLLARIEAEVRAGNEAEVEELIEEAEELIEKAQERFKEFQAEGVKASGSEENDRGRPDSLGRGGRDDGEGDDDDEEPETTL